MGARPLRRAIQRYIEDPLADFVLGRELMPGSTIVVARKSDEEVDIDVIPPTIPEDVTNVTVPPEEPRSEDEDEGES
jgi:ATP-dependent Clp protease ATP-binding subunit ClpC